MKIFENPTIEIITFTTEDILSSSGGGNNIDANVPNASPWG